MNQTEIINIFTKKTLGLTFVLSAAALAFAQEKVGISGTVVNKNNQPVPYASVTFSNKANKLLSDATLTDEKGQYTLELTPGNYDISIEAIDYKKAVVNKQIAAAGNIGAFSIEPEASATNLKTQDIQAVVITAPSTKPYKVELDKRTYDPSQDIVSRGGNLQDVLSNVPSVSVDTDGTVSMRGSSNVKFLINGKPSALLGIDDGANALQSIPADQIERIEVITNPSSKFEASGTAGILNIILKKNKKMGFNGSVTGTLGYLPQTNMNTNLSWRKGKFTWFLNGGGGYRESKNTNRNTNWFNNAVAATDETYTDQESITKSKSNNYNASGGLTFDITDRTSVNASGTVRTFDSENDGRINYLYQYLNTPDAFRQRLNTGSNNNLAFQGDFGLDHKFDDKGQNISLSLSIQRNRSYNDTDVNDQSNNIFLLQDDISQKTVNKSIVGKADYELPIGEASKLEAGYRLDVNNNDYNNMVLESTATNPIQTYLGNYSYNAIYKEMFNAFYLQFKSKIGKLGYQLGLRDEISKIDIDYLNLNGLGKTQTKNYNNLFPSVFLSYDIAKDNQFLVNYSRRIDRPRSFFLIPNPSYSDNQNIFDGNIDLNPSYVDSYEFGYSISKKSFTINPTLYYRHSTDDVKMLVYRTNENDLPVFHTKPVNLGTDDRYGLDFNFNWDATKWLRLMGNLDLFGYKTTGSYYDATVMDKPMSFEGSGFSTRARLTSTFKIDKTFNFQLQGFYRGGQKTQSQDRKDMYAINFGASKTVLDGNGTISFNIQDIFNTRAMRSTTYSADFTRDSYMQWQPRQFALSFTYRFKQGEKIDQPKRKKDINSNAAGDDQQAPM
ncbi:MULTISPECIES: TonB-dependent receptor domain-containing protein [Chryseobacterium]|uniref:Iron complex outermembrane receptor protein n=1 Tax=Chryseobacterium camelliae TaxID=1265445 RepID=A0ABU0TFE4_9FLAO|nr:MULTISPECIES: TonB-dependent receptor [Chryseobacterium]MDT3406469.1 iron complex outermembrane receptor protein [Pseudacidovorax intermedius]MDQ1095732.1 iron complex outermembrane receptor protein [Chryseobacterium camelliae]MDQ1099668.1 iron complex outermembrane receptor protein [Chryseobacterium sp. SORGH_AS_1048]MDR6087017.1 iron complex outermembrane receptor protein [Chryseobacterium sp. SORGH_AS_0909]MDR6131389.1 iron complex outermembrane receptor protein [Chryseobacterium sp. SOR